ncbi:hydroxyethylthiazole kinase [Pseudooceanicola sediminis]|uniref:Hydroxyethylthiazole kinase n=1 Tax=Pseudooceanicola sediminis TaxID=2211117 RepID=A0A399J053_9RHOB|nr:hydroxyethylthiazole kinase [Pseudooceanicola sediminis]KAA2311416.1 hydroxyethylthiazole kinase [Puniceibacterium sp. HSS470]RII38037.1 hydroxyethylthiazole kinase [Pseudooceanicola sediminis]|tara:strand:+ start:4953 stop:5753 length:801 start_codon:yes stop_codon:yes gene_type:complete
MQVGTTLGAMRAATPLVQCITNYVAMNVAANVLLAAGASPAMVSDAEEAGEFAAIAGALTVNIGTLSAPFVAGMRAAIAGAEGTGTPWVLDPVACQATALRRRVAADLVALKPTIIRANASEILSLAGEASRGQGVDGRDSTAAAQGAASRLAQRTGGVVAMTGAVDFVTDGMRAVRIAGGSSWMPLNTALGCSLTGLCGAFAAVAAPFEASVAALALFAVAGRRAHGAAEGPGSFAPLFLDALHQVGPDDLDREARIEVLEVAAA